MNSSLKKALVLFAVLFFANIKAQSDVINTVKGEKILCKIVREDSARIYFKLGGSAEASMLRTQVRSIKYSHGKNDVRSQNDTAGAIGSNSYLPDKKVNKEAKRLNNFITLSIGIALPQGIFAGSDINNEASGFAKSGINYGVSYTHLSSNTIGIILKIISASNEFDTEPLTTYALKKTGYLWMADKGYWQSLGFSTGFVLFKDVDDFRFLGRVTAGYMNLKSPYVYIYIDKNNWIKQESASTNSICLGLGGSLSYKIVNDISINFDVDYYKANFLFSRIDTYTSANTSSSSQNVKQPMGNLFLSAGLCYHF